MKRYAVAMAGGAGLRLWPLSRQSKPKQFISVDGDECMLIKTIRRICKNVSPEDCHVITNESLLGITRDTLKNLIPLSNIIIEPMRKNTAACITHAAMVIRQRRGPGILCFVPADGHVKDTEAYQLAVSQALEAAERTGELVVIGIVPTYPATGYGYIHTDKDPEARVLKVYRFTEKPDAETAMAMAESGAYLWNGGIVVGAADVIINSIKAHLPGHFDALSAATEHMDKPDYAERIRQAYEKLDDISFDYGVLEKAQAIYAVRGNFAWDDIGTFDALSKTLKKDEYGNAVSGQHLLLDTHDCVICSAGPCVAAIGVDRLIVAATEDALIVCPRERAQEIKTLADQLGQKGLDTLL